MRGLGEKPASLLHLEDCRSFSQYTKSTSQALLYLPEQLPGPRAPPLSLGASPPQNAISVPASLMSTSPWSVNRWATGHPHCSNHLLTSLSQNQAAKPPSFEVIPCSNSNQNSSKSQVSARAEVLSCVLYMWFSHCDSTTTTEKVESHL